MTDRQKNKTYTFPCTFDTRLGHLTPNQFISLLDGKYNLEELRQLIDAKVALDGKYNLEEMGQLIDAKVASAEIEFKAAHVHEEEVDEKSAEEEQEAQKASSVAKNELYIKIVDDKVLEMYDLAIKIDDDKKLYLFIKIDDGKKLYLFVDDEFAEILLNIITDDIVIDHFCATVSRQSKLLEHGAKTAIEYEVLNGVCVYWYQNALKNCAQGSKTLKRYTEQFEEALVKLELLKSRTRTMNLGLRLKEVEFEIEKGRLESKLAQHKKTLAGLTAHRHEFEATKERLESQLTQHKRTIAELTAQEECVATVPMLRVFNNTARFVDQGSGKRKGSFPMHLEPWHIDIFSFLDLCKNHTNHDAEDDRACDLWFYLWIPNLSMRRVESDGKGSLFCPNEAKGLFEVYGSKSDALYAKYESEKWYKKQIKDCELWTAILQSQIETGTPYMVYKDAYNHKTNRNNLGTIKTSNVGHRPIGIGVKGLADVFMLLRMEFDSDKAQELNKQIFEAIYFGALTALDEIAHKISARIYYFRLGSGACDLFFGLWISNLSMRRAESDGKRSLFCPNEAKGKMSENIFVYDDANSFVFYTIERYDTQSSKAVLKDKSVCVSTQYLRDFEHESVDSQSKAIAIIESDNKMNDSFIASKCDGCDISVIESHMKLFLCDNGLDSALGQINKYSFYKFERFSVSEILHSTTAVQRLMELEHSSIHKLNHNICSLTNDEKGHLALIGVYIAVGLCHQKIVITMAPHLKEKKSHSFKIITDLICDYELNECNKEMDLFGRNALVQMCKEMEIASKMKETVSNRFAIESCLNESCLKREMNVYIEQQCNDCVTFLMGLIFAKTKSKNESERNSNILLESSLQNILKLMDNKQITDASKTNLLLYLIECIPFFNGLSLRIQRLLLQCIVNCGIGQYIIRRKSCLYLLHLFYETMFVQNNSKSMLKALKKSMLKALKNMERVTVLNANSESYSEFRYYKDSDHKKGSFLKHLWTFKYNKEESETRTITCLEWNAVHLDLFGVGYGSYDFNAQTNGMICIYSLKSTAFPEKIVRCESGVMCLSFHPKYSSLICVGLYDGSVTVYDIRIYSSQNPESHHFDPVWDIQWYSNPPKLDLMFYSISSDSEIKCRKLSQNELIHETLIKLKTPNIIIEDDITDISQATNCDSEDSEMNALCACFDFNPEMEHLYLVGTEDGHIMQCHKTYNDKYVKLHKSAHFMNIYCLKWNRFHSKVFMSCSEDWTIKLWEIEIETEKSKQSKKEMTPIITYDLGSSVNDICWNYDLFLRIVPFLQSVTAFNDKQCRLLDDTDLSIIFEIISETYCYGLQSLISALVLDSAVMSKYLSQLLECVMCVLKHNKAQWNNKHNHTFALANVQNKELSDMRSRAIEYKGCIGASCMNNPPFVNTHSLQLMHDTIAYFKNENINEWQSGEDAFISQSILSTIGNDAFEKYLSEVVARPLSPRYTNEDSKKWHTHTNNYQQSLAMNESNDNWYFEAESLSPAQSKMKQKIKVAAPKPTFVPSELPGIAPSIPNNLDNKLPFEIAKPVKSDRKWCKPVLKVLFLALFGFGIIFGVNLFTENEGMTIVNNIAYDFKRQISKIVSESKERFECGESGDETVNGYAMNEDELVSELSVFAESKRSVSNLSVFDQSKHSGRFAYFKQNILPEMSTLTINKRGQYFSYKSLKSPLCRVREWAARQYLRIGSTVMIVLIVLGWILNAKSKQWRKTRIDAMISETDNILEEFHKFNKQRYVPIDVIKQRIKPKSHSIWADIEWLLQKDIKIIKSIQMSDGMQKQCVTNQNMTNQNMYNFANWSPSQSQTTQTMLRTFITKDKGEHIIDSMFLWVIRAQNRMEIFSKQEQTRTLDEMAEMEFIEEKEFDLFNITLIIAEFIKIFLELLFKNDSANMHKLMRFWRSTLSTAQTRSLCTTQACIFYAIFTNSANPRMSIMSNDSVSLFKSKSLPVKIKIIINQFGIQCIFYLKPDLYY